MDSEKIHKTNKLHNGYIYFNLSSKEQIKDSVQFFCLFNVTKCTHFQS